jgi:putative SOS response-associated peptidase YedK
MCGRFSLTKDEITVNERFRVTGGVTPYIPRFNSAPGQLLAVITNEQPDSIQYLRWGLIPFWATNPTIGNRLINARSETADEKPAFKKAFQSRRCLVLSDGFFEWKKSGQSKVPYYFFLKTHQLFSMAGLWETWKHNNRVLDTFTILTTTPNRLMKPIHHRMPVILPQNEEENWLKNPDTTDLKKLLKPYPDDETDMYPVSSLVNSPQNDTPAVIRPLKNNPGKQKELF